MLSREYLIYLVTSTEKHFNCVVRDSIYTLMETPMDNWQSELLEMRALDMMSGRGRIDFDSWTDEGLERD